MQRSISYTKNEMKKLRELEKLLDVEFDRWSIVSKDGSPLRKIQIVQNKLIVITTFSKSAKDFLYLLNRSGLRCSDISSCFKECENNNELKALRIFLQMIDLAILLFDSEIDFERVKREGANFSVERESVNSRRLETSGWLEKVKSMNSKKNESEE